MVPIAWSSGQRPIDGYTLERCIGRGAFGEVWAALGPGGIPVALKRVELRRDTKCGAHELSALELLKRVRHPHLMAIHGCWLIEDLLIIGCELADQNLAQRFQLTTGDGSVGVPLRELLDYLYDAAEALDYLCRPIHTLDGRAVRIQHCDIKPANLLLQGGAVKVADFGLAKALERILIKSSASGTPAYAPPEFFRGMVASSSDQYSLGITYCQLRTGKLPFRGSVAEMMEGHLHGVPDLSGLSDNEKAIVRRALEKNPKLRWDNCTKFIGELERGLRPVATVPASAIDELLPSTNGSDIQESNLTTREFHGNPITTGKLLVNGDWVEIPLRRTEVKVAVVGPAADVQMTQFFVNTYDRPIEATYVFPLPDDAAVHRMRMFVGERAIVGEVEEILEARARYDQAKQTGRGAAVVEQNSRGVFSAAVANILAGQEIRIEIRYLQTVPMDEGRFRIVVPTVVAPKYLLGSDPAAEKMCKNDSELNLDTRLPSGMVRGDSFDISVDLDAGVPLCGFDSPSHDMETMVDEEVTRVQLRLRKRVEVPNRDFVLTYRVRGPKIEHAMLCEPGVNGDSGTFLLFTTPPDTSIPNRDSRHIAIVIDCSISMHGAPLRQAKLAALRILDHLQLEDEFNIIAFGDRAMPLSASFLQASQVQIDRGRAFIEALHAQGGKELLEPLRFALQSKIVSADSESKPKSWIAGAYERVLGAIASSKEQPPRTLILITDGAITGERELIQALAPIIKRCRVLALGVGVAIHRYLLDRLAVTSHGIAEYLHPNEDGRDTIDRAWRRMGSLLLTDLRWVARDSDVSFLIPEQLPDLYGDMPLQIIGRYRGKSPPRFQLRGRLNGRKYVHEIIPDQMHIKATGVPLSALWAKRQIEVWKEKLREHPEENQTLSKQMIELAVRYRLASDLTSLLAIDQQPSDSQEPPTKVAIPQVAPQNWSATATPTLEPQNGSESAPRAGLHSKLQRVRKPRVQIAYETFGGAALHKSLPFAIGVIGRFSPGGGSRTPLEHRLFMAVDRDNFDDVRRVLCNENGPDVQNESDRSQIEASWSGLRYLVYSSETGVDLKIYVLDCSKDELARQMDFGDGALSSPLYAKLSRRLAESNEIPFGALIADFEFGNRSEDLGCMAGLGRIAAATHCPIVTAVDANFWGRSDLEKISREEISSQNKNPAGWNAFRASDSARFLAVTIPQLTISSAYVIGVKLADAHSKFGWCTSISGKEHGKVEGLVCRTNILSVGAVARFYEEGFQLVCQTVESKIPVFLESPTMHRPFKGTQEPALADTLPFAVAVARVAHYVSRIVGSRISRETRDWPTASDLQNVERALKEFAFQLAPSPTDANPAHTRNHFPWAAVQFTVRPEQNGRKIVVLLHLTPWNQEPLDSGQNSDMPYFYTVEI